MYQISIIRSHFRQIESWKPVSSRHFWRLYYNPIEGAYVDDIPLVPSKIIGIPPTIEVKQSHDRCFEQFYIHFSVPHPFDRYPEIVIVEPHDYIKTCLELMIEERKKNQEGSIIPLDHNISMKQIHLISYLLSHLKPKGNYFKDNRVSEAVQFIEKDFSKELTNESIAQKLQLSVNGFSRLFKECTGLTPHQYLLKTRLTNSAEMLSNHKLTIDTIAESCGFCDRAHFSRLFKKEFNISPVKYRKEILT